MSPFEGRRCPPHPPLPPPWRGIGGTLKLEVAFNLVSKQLLNSLFLVCEDLSQLYLNHSALNSGLVEMLRLDQLPSNNFASTSIQANLQFRHLSQYSQDFSQQRARFQGVSSHSDSGVKSNNFTTVSASSLDANIWETHFA